MASTNMQREIPSDLPWIYDVFLSFRGEDTRKTFTGHLYSALDDKGIFTFKDNHRLERGKVISLELLKAIEESRSSVIVFSENYASSTWCLDELAKILQCMKDRGQIVFPVFYHVNPTDVRKQMGSFAKAFAEHEKDFREDLEKVQEWRVALREIANLSGWHLQDREEPEFIKVIVDEISNKLSPILINTSGNLIGIDSRMKRMDSLLDMGLSNVRMLGICGMGGIGKTTIAKLVFDEIFNQFDGSIFLSNVREVSMTQGLVALQRKLISVILGETNINKWDDHRVSNEIRRRLRHKRILVILDDVDKLEQLQALAGMHDWFCLGSRIIITTRDQRLLFTHGVDKVYMVDKLNHSEALQLFCWKAFRKSHPTNDYVELSLQMVNYADGLPLALEVLGSFLFGRSKTEWKDALDRLRKVPDERIFEILKISYDGLHGLEKKIFLDISCFFTGRDKEEVREILDSFDFNPDIGISVLIDKCVISLSNNILCMHDLIQCMGREIVRQECLEMPGRRSRLWLPDDIYRVLKRNEGTEAVEGIVLDFPTCKGFNLNAKSFSRMNNLRLLKIKDVSLFEDLEYLSEELRVLNWHGYPLRSLPSNFQPDKLFELNICYSHVKQLWNNGEKHMHQLKIIILSHSICLTKTPNFTEVPNLERLFLDGCTSLSFVHPSIGLLKRLILLNLKDCKQLSSLRTETECESLEVLILSGCSKLVYFQGIVASSKHLLQLSLDGTSIKELPSIQHLTRLEVLNLKGCSKLKKLPDDLGHVVSLKNLDLDGTAIGELPSSISLLKNLQKLSLQGCKGQPCKSSNLLSIFSRFRRANLSGSMGLRLPSFSGLCSLRHLNLGDCNLQEGAIPYDIGFLPSLNRLDLSGNNFVTLPPSLSRLTKLGIFIINDCSRLKVLPVLPAGTEKLFANNCASLELVSTSPSNIFRSTQRIFSFSNCFNLPGAQGSNRVITAFFKNVLQSLLKGQLQGVTDENFRCSEFDIIVSGSQVPKWFHYRDIGDFVRIQQPIHVGSNTFRGLAICAAFKVYHREGLSALFLDPRYNTSKLTCSLTVGFSRSYVAMSFNTILMPGSDHLWICYVSRSYLGGKFLPEEHSIIEAKFRVIEHEDIILKLKECGLCPVFATDTVEFIQASNNACSSTRFEELDHESLALNSAIIKRIRDYHSLDQQPCPKRLR